MVNANNRNVSKRVLPILLPKRFWRRRYTTMTLGGSRAVVARHLDGKAIELISHVRGIVGSIAGR